MGLYKQGVASTGPFSTTGESHLVLPGAQVIDRLSLRLLAFPPAPTRIVGTMYPRGFWHVGEAGTGSWPDDSIGANPAIIHFSEFLHHEHQLWFPPTPQGAPVASGSIWWRWVLGVTVELEAFW